MADFELVLPGARPTSWNIWWSGKHWGKRTEVANLAKMLVREHIDPETVKIFTRPVHATYTVYFDHHPQDCSNICIKPYEDALIGWVLEDDRPKFVEGISIYSRVDKENPRIEIHITELQPFVLSDTTVLDG